MDHSATNTAIWPKPLTLTVILALTAIGLNSVVPLISFPSVPVESMIVGATIVAIAAIVAVLAFREMERARTTYLPGGNADFLVQTGVFRRTRNPIYLAFVLSHIGLGIATANAWLIVTGVFIAIYITARVIRREEAYLHARFGPAYAEYCRRVRRWF